MPMHINFAYINLKSILISKCDRLNTSFDNFHISEFFFEICYFINESDFFGNE